MLIGCLVLGAWCLHSDVVTNLGLQVFIGLSVLCKETGITAAAAATVYELYVAQGLDPRRLIYPSEPATTLGGPSKKASSRKDKAVKASAQHAIALRLLLLWVGTALILIVRLSMNKQSITVDAKTNPANHMTEFLPRAMTKNFYVALHAWLLIFPKSLCCDWSGSAIALVESVWDGRNLATAALYAAIGFLGYEVTLSKRTQWFKAEMAFGLSLLVVPFLPACGTFDIVLGHVPHSFKLYATPHAPCDVIYLVPVLVVC